MQSSSRFSWYQSKSLSFLLQSLTWVSWFYCHSFTSEKNMYVCVLECVFLGAAWPEFASSGEGFGNVLGWKQTCATTLKSKATAVQPSQYIFILCDLQLDDCKSLYVPYHKYRKTEGFKQWRMWERCETRSLLHVFALKTVGDYLSLFVPWFVKIINSSSVSGSAPYLSLFALKCAVLFWVITQIKFKLRPFYHSK